MSRFGSKSEWDPGSQLNSIKRLDCILDSSNVKLSLVLLWRNRVSWWFDLWGSGVLRGNFTEKFKLISLLERRMAMRYPRMVAKHVPAFPSGYFSSPIRQDFPCGWSVSHCNFRPTLTFDHVIKPIWSEALIIFYIHEWLNVSVKSRANLCQCANFNF
jgi:hypothetical protein